MSFGRKALVVLGVAVVLTGGGALGFAPLVRSRIAALALRHNISIDVGGVRPGWFAITLSHVHVRPDSIHGVDAQVDELRVELTSLFAVEHVIARGGAIQIDAAPATLAREVREWREKQPTGSGGNGSSIDLRGEGFSLTWHSPEDATFLVDARGISISRDAEGYKFEVEGASAQQEGLAVHLATASAELTRAGELRSAHAASVDLTSSGDSDHANDQAIMAPPDPIAPPPLPSPATKKTHDHTKVSAIPASPAATTQPENAPFIAIPDLHAARARIAMLARSLADRFPDEATIAVDGLSLAATAHGDHIAVGPAPFQVSRNDGKFAITFASARDESPRPTASTPLSLSAEIPIDAGDVIVSLSGGPVALPLLGIKEGDAGLTDVAHATLAGHGRVVLDDAADSLTFDGALETKNLAIRQPRIASDVVRGLNLAVSARGMVSDHGELRLDDAETTLGAIHATLHGAFQQSPDRATASFSLEIPVASCQALLESVPSALFPTLAGAHMSGTFGARGHVAFDSRDLDNLALDYAIDDRCAITDAPAELSRDRFASSFSHRIYHPDGKIGEETTGPGTANWTDLDRISPYMQVAVLTTEDGAFPRHHGFNPSAIRNAIISNLKARRFVRGASTITMQLAKNLFLTREKTLSRKLEEMILADYLEQIFRKDDMMELYLNIIEFGPDIYGITHAAAYYFGRKPEELNLVECLFLSSIMPAPLRYHHLFEKGDVPEYWMKHLHQLMEIAQRTGKISQSELTEALAEPLVFQKPNDPPPTPRPPVMPMHIEADEMNEGDSPSP
jgi:hypothetical protein